MFLTSLCLHRLLLSEPQSAGAGVDDPTFGAPLLH